MGKASKQREGLTANISEKEKPTATMKPQGISQATVCFKKTKRKAKNAVFLQEVDSGDGRSR